MSLCTKYVLLSTMLYISYFELNAVKNYGQFEMQVTNVKTCKGPKRKDCANSTITMLGPVSITCDIAVMHDMSLVKGKVVGTLDNEEVVKMQIHRICDHIFFTPIFKAFLRMTDKCVIQKDRYTYSINLADIIHNYHGTTFMFGNWTYKAIFYNDECNLICSIFQMAITPKKAN